MPNFLEMFQDLIVGLLVYNLKRLIFSLFLSLPHIPVLTQASLLCGLMQ